MSLRDFYADASELFGFDRVHADNLLWELEQEDFDVDTDSLRDTAWQDFVAESAVDLMDESYHPSLGLELDDMWEYGDDEWVEAGEEVELSVSYEEGEA